MKSFFNRFTSHSLDRFIDLGSSESAYLRTLEKIIYRGQSVPNRTKFNTFKISGCMLSYPISKSRGDSYRIPIFTTKKIFYKGAICEMLWMLQGKTDISDLHKNDVHIWDANSTREYLDHIGLYDYPVGSLGPIYGHQWTNWGAEWTPSGSNGIGINQVINVINSLKNFPEDRRHVISGWNPSDISKMAVPPCHMTYVFDVTDVGLPNKILNCFIFIRSNDMFLGHPFNVIGGSLLLILLSKIVNMEPGTLTTFIANAHIYENHKDQVMQQISREPLFYPRIKIPDLTIEKENGKTYGDIAYNKICGLSYNDFIITDYNHWPKIPADMVP